MRRPPSRLRLRVPSRQAAAHRDEFQTSPNMCLCVSPADAGVLVAKVEATSNPVTSKRFGVKGFPTLKFFADGQVRDYAGGRDLESMSAFALGGYADVDGADVPAGPQWYHEVIAQLDPHLTDDIEHIVAIRKTAAALLAIGGGVIGALLTMMVCGCNACKKDEGKSKKA